MANELGSALVIPQSLLNKLDEADKKIIKIAQDSEQTATTFNMAFKNMAETSVAQLIAALQTVDNKVASISNNASGIATLSNAIQQTSTQAQSLSESITQAADNINKMSTTNVSGINISELKANIAEINRTLNSTETTLSKSTQQTLVNRRAAMQEELKIQETSTDKRIQNEERASDAAQKVYLDDERRYLQSLDTKIKAAQDYQLRQQQITNQQTLAKNTTVEGSLAYASSATTINERTQAIKYLTAARANLSTTDKDYAAKLQNLNSAILQMNMANKEAIAGSKELQTAHKGLLDTSGQLARAFALMFSVSQIRGFIQNIADVRGQFELQQVSLEAILQNKTKADEIFQQTVDLAVKSPFRIKDLISYTKQLAAYRIEGDKLFDTTKRLADVSAGLGVDMQRLILAYGQVKAASYLRGFDFMATLYGNIEDITPLIAGTPRKGQSAAKYAIAA